MVQENNGGSGGTETQMGAYACLSETSKDDIVRVKDRNVMRNLESELKKKKDFSEIDKVHQHA